MTQELTLNAVTCQNAVIKYIPRLNILPLQFRPNFRGIHSQFGERLLKQFT
jgi:hypothetical protein